MIQSKENKKKRNSIKTFELSKTLISLKFLITIYKHTLKDHLVGHGEEIIDRVNSHFHP